MPLKSKNVSGNIKELQHGKVGSARKKAIRTLAKKRGISLKSARHKLSVAIAMSKAKKK